MNATKIPPLGTPDVDQRTASPVNVDGRVIDGDVASHPRYFRFSPLSMFVVVLVILGVFEGAFFLLAFRLPDDRIVVELPPSSSRVEPDDSDE